MRKLEHDIVRKAHNRASQDTGLCPESVKHLLVDLMSLHFKVFFYKVKIKRGLP